MASDHGFERFVQNRFETEISLRDFRKQILFQPHEKLPYQFFLLSDTFNFSEKFKSI
jgi:hypothetical protein